MTIKISFLSFIVEIFRLYFHQYNHLVKINKIPQIFRTSEKKIMEMVVAIERIIEKHDNEKIIL